MCSNLTTFFASNVDAPLLLPHLAVKRRKIRRRRKWMRLNLDKHRHESISFSQTLEIIWKAQTCNVNARKSFCNYFYISLRLKNSLFCHLRFKLFYASPLRVFYNGKFRVIDLECNYERYFLHFTLFCAPLSWRVPFKATKGVQNNVF